MLAFIIILFIGYVRAKRDDEMPMDIYGSEEKFGFILSFFSTFFWVGLTYILFYLIDLFIAIIPYGLAMIGGIPLTIYLVQKFIPREY